MKMYMLIKTAMVSSALIVVAGCSEYGDFTTEQICKASLAVIKGKSPTMMMTDKVVKEEETGLDVFYISYPRPDDNNKWHVRCKVNKKRAIWAQNEGRWRDQAQDPTIRFVINDDEIEINEMYPDGSAAKKVTFNISMLGGRT
ncbi:hypothetical protein [Enterovibrio norvegicus]|nr:hypothetical protein [Enterovibrio norvegicus]